MLIFFGFGWKFFKSLRTEEDEPIYTYNDKFMRWSVRQSIKRGRLCAFIQFYKSKSCDGILKIISDELNLQGKIFDNLEANLNYRKKYFENFEKEYENQFNDYREEDEEENEEFINDN